jgi:tetratricopeptide (TPR) repeat protein
MASTEADSAELVQQAIAALGRGALDQAEAFCRQALQTAELGEAYHILAIVDLRRGRNAEAVANGSRAAQLGADGWRNLLLLGAAHMALGQLQRAHETLLAAAGQNPADVEIAARLLSVTLRLHGASSAETTYRELFAPLSVRRIDEAWLRLALQAGVSIEPPARVQLAPQDTARRWAERSGVEVLALGEVEQIPIQRIGAEAPTSHVAGNPPYVVDLPDVQVFAYSHAVLTHDGYALNEAGGHADYGRFVDHRSDAAVIAQHEGKLLLRAGAFEMQDLEEGVWLAGPASDAFGHWIGEFAPRLEFLERHPAFAGRPIIVDEGMPASHLDLLAMLCPNPLITLRRGHGLRVRRLLYAPTPTFFPIHLLPNDLPPFAACCASVRSYRFLKARVERALGAAPATGGKYYLSRANRSWRRIRNEDEVRAHLERYGYRTVMTEDLSFAEQVRLFQGAAAVIAPTGSAMQNFIYAPTDVRLFVLTQSNVHNHAAFNGQARALGYDPQFICGEAAGDAGQKHIDYVIPLGSLAPATA